MLQLINYSIFEESFQKSDFDNESIEDLMNRLGLNGLEIIRYDGWQPDRLLPKNIFGVHMQFWPIWLDFWRSDEAKLVQQFGSREIYEMYYGGDSKETLVHQYRKELLEAQSIGASYVVCHIGHVELEHCYNYQFTYSDEEVTDAFIHWMNTVLEGLDIHLEILFENTWWPGLTFRNKEIASRIMQKIQYPQKGFMLDVGHLMNTQLDLQTEQEAVEWLIQHLEALGEIKNDIKGIHLHSSLSGSYVKACLQSQSPYNFEQPFWDRYFRSFEHIGKIDRHQPFQEKSVRQLVHFIAPKYLVHEFSTGSMSELEAHLATQMKALEVFERVVEGKICY